MTQRAAVAESLRLAPRGAHRDLPGWALFVFAWGVMYVPTYWDAARSLWNTDAQAHGPLVLAIAGWVFWRKRNAILEGPCVPSSTLGGTLLLFGLCAYLVGRSQAIPALELGSQIPVLAGSLLVFRGFGALRAAWFPLVFLLFLIPLPGTVVVAMTEPLKQWASTIVTELLYWAGYPVARNGVVLSIGQYQLLVADACSGLHGMFSLSAFGLWFVYLAAPRSRVNVGILLLSTVPIAFAANVVRILLLVLITYYLGERAGQGFLHNFAGITAFVVAALVFFVIYLGLSRFSWRGFQQTKARA